MHGHVCDPLIATIREILYTGMPCMPVFSFKKSCDTVATATRETIMAPERRPDVISLAERRLRSDQFKTLFRRSMDLIEETADYLDGQGRTDAKKLERYASLAFGTHSINLTTCLMQNASWLLVHRAASEGDMTLDECMSGRNRVVPRVMKAVPTESVLPETMFSLIERAHALSLEIVRMHKMFHPSEQS